MSMCIATVLKASLKVTVQKTGKTYYRTMNYAKRIIKGGVGKPKTTEYFLREGRGWREVTEKEFKDATSKEAVQELHVRLEEELKQRVEQIMSEEETTISQT